MAIGFNFTAPDYAGRAAAGLSLDPSDPNPPAPFAMPAAQPQVAPTAAAPQPFKPGLLDVLQGMIFDGQSPAEAGMAARERDYQRQTMAIMADTLKNAPQDQRLAMLLNPAKLGEAVASRFQSMALKGGETRDNGEGAPSTTAPLLGFDAVSGRGFTQTPGSTTPTGPSLGGGFSAKDGLISSDRTGQVSGTYALPQLKPAGSSLDSFTPGVSGGQFPALPGQAATGAAPTPPAAIPAPSAAGLVVNGRLDPQAFFRTFTGPHEGGLNPRDLNGSPTNYGINQKANPDVDVSKLTPQGAASIFANKYFAASGAANLPPALAAVHADTAFINPSKAQEFLAQSGGDPSKYMDLREGWMNNLEQRFPAAQQYAQAWNTRNADLRTLAGQLGGAQATQGSGSTGSAMPGASTIQELAPATRPTILDPNDPANASVYANLPKGTVLQQEADGTRSVLQKPEYSPEAKSTIRDHVLSSDAYKQSMAAQAAYKAMIGNANTMTGPSAYSMLDTFARAINPGAVARPTVIQTIEQNLGLPAQLVGRLDSAFGSGNLPPQVRQQIVDAVVPFAQAHWDQANMLNNANAALAKQHGFDPIDVTAPLDARPQRIGLTVPPAAQRQPGLYSTPKGPMKWTGTGWLPAN